MFLGFLAATYWTYRSVPTGFVPDEDQGYIMVIIQAPQGASLDYTMNIEKQAEAAVKSMPETSRMFAVGGFGFAGVGAQPGHHVHHAEGLQGACRAGALRAGAGRQAVRRVQPDHRARWSFRSCRRRSTAWAQFGGFTYELLDQSGGPIENLQNAAQRS